MIADKMRADLKEAIKARDDARKDILRVALGDVSMAENRKGQSSPLEDDQVAKILQKIIGGNSETLEHLADGDARRQVLLRENELLTGYLPKSLSEQEIRDLLSPVADKIKEAKADGPAVGMAMGMIKKSGKTADGSLVSQVVKSIRGA